MSFGRGIRSIWCVQHLCIIYITPISAVNTVLVCEHQLVAGDRVSTRAPKEAPGIFPLRVLYYASPPDLCLNAVMPNCRHKKAARLSGADDRFWFSSAISIPDNRASCQYVAVNPSCCMALISLRCQSTLRNAIASSSWQTASRSSQ